MRPYSNDLRERVINDIDAGISIRKAAVKWHISPRVISQWLKRYRETGSYSPVKGNRGVRPKLIEYRELLKTLLRNVRI
ncbi:MAG: helix-turn-helix domain-containing protein [Thermoguttaceae bacterium]|nr:helix-turn-helix domain-containing protein [Thermoguttaceae bacterium]